MPSNDDDNREKFSPANENFINFYCCRKIFDIGSSDNEIVYVTRFFFRIFWCDLERFARARQNFIKTTFCKKKKKIIYLEKFFVGFLRNFFGSRQRRKTGFFENSTFKKLPRLAFYSKILRDFGAPPRVAYFFSLYYCNIIWMHHKHRRAFHTCPVYTKIPVTRRQADPKIYYHQKNLFHVFRVRELDGCDRRRFRVRWVKFCQKFEETTWTAQKNEEKNT